jgi:hypothetical protein
LIELRKSIRIDLSGIDFAWSLVYIKPIKQFDLLKFGGEKASTEILRLLVAYRAFCQLVKLAEKKVIADDYNYAVAA